MNGQHEVKELSDAPQLRPTCLGSGIDKDRADYTVYCDGWNVGRVYETRGGATIAALIPTVKGAQCSRNRPVDI